MVPEAAVGGQRLDAEDVEQRMLGLAGIERRKQCIVVDQTAATDVDQHRPRLHRRKEIRIDHVLGPGGMRYAEHHHIAIAEMVGQLIRCRHRIRGWRPIDSDVTLDPDLDARA